MALPRLPGAEANVVALRQHQRGLCGPSRQGARREKPARKSPHRRRSRMNILVAFGTRPEAIKLFPVIHELQQDEDFDVTVCVTAQHREMLDQVLDIAKITPDIDLNIMQPNQTL